MTIENLTSKESTGPTGIIDKAIELAQSGDPSGVLSPAFTEALKTVRKQDESYYLLQIKPRIKSLKTEPPVSIGDIEKLTKPPKATKQRYQEKNESSGEDAPRMGKTEMLISMITATWKADIFSDESGKPYASFMVSAINADTGEAVPPHRETWPLESKQFRAKTSREFYHRFGIAAGETAVKEAIEILSADADDKPREDVFLRYATMPGEVPGVYVDLGDDEWQIVEITGGGWRIMQAAECPVKFRRVQHSRALPMPERGGDIEQLWQHVNIAGDDDRLLVVAWLLECMRINTPYPVLELIAGQGSAKSTTQERLRALIDPNAVMLRIEPRSNQDLSVSAISNHMISLNNMSHLSTSMQDFMCSVSTGGGDATRRLHTTEDEAVWDTKRPIIMNGINQLVTRPDLADRAVCIELEKIRYIDEATLKQAWAQDYPKLTGALYDLMAGVLRDLPSVIIDKLPRMGDFAKLGAAMCMARKDARDFVSVFNRNRDSVVARGVESSPVALALVSRIRARGVFEGTAGELMGILEEFQPLYFDKQAWPKSPRGLGEVLRRLAPSLSVYGIEVQQERGSGNRVKFIIQKISAGDVPEG